MGSQIQGSGFCGGGLEVLGASHGARAEARQHRG